MTSASPRLLLVDNYDSFTYNLVQAFLVLGAQVEVRRNDEISVEQARAFAPTHLCISPGPGTPHDAGVSIEMPALRAECRAPYIASADVCIALPITTCWTSAAGTPERSRAALMAWAPRAFALMSLK